MADRLVNIRFESLHCSVAWLALIWGLYVGAVVQTIFNSFAIELK